MTNDSALCNTYAHEALPVLPQDGRAPNLSTGRRRLPARAARVQGAGLRPELLPRGLSSRVCRVRQREQGASGGRVCRASRGDSTPDRRGNCYVTSEALYHLLGGKAAGWLPMRTRHEGDSHWFLRHSSGLILDATASQFRELPDYSRARGCGFLTRQPSRRAARLMAELVYQNKGG